MLRAQDLSLLVKKIAVGIAVTLIPAAILLGGLWFTQHVLANHHPTRIEKKTGVK
jgi:hypothetical protein